MRLKIKMKVNVIGLGYIGLPTALMLSAHGVSVTGTDYNKELVNSLNAGKLTFKEDGLLELFKKAQSRDIKFTDQYIAADIYIVAVPTPYRKDTKKIDATFVKNAVLEILRVCKKGAIIAIESTISPGTIDKVIRPEIESAKKVISEDVFLAHVPERILPGNMLYELLHNSRTIGTDDPKTALVLKALYSAFCEGDIVLTDIRTAEMTKVVENTYRDINIAFANELAKICRSDNMDVYEIIKIANMHPRVNILSPGPGVGGHCISVDPWFLVGDYPKVADIILKARQINDNMPGFVLERIHTIMREEGIKDFSRVGLYGLTYKENVDDTRESPSLQLIEKMRDSHITGFFTYDPMIKRPITNNQLFDLETFLSKIDMVVVLVAHSELYENSGEFLRKVVFDTRNALSGFHVHKL